MLTKNIRLKGFGITKNKKKFALQVSKKLNFYKKSRLINSFSENYRFDFKDRNGQLHWFHGFITDVNQYFNPPLHTPINQSTMNISS